MSITIAEFLNRLEQSGILDAAQFAAVQQKAAHAGDDAEAFVKQLHKAGDLTGYQAQALWKNKGQELAFGNYVVEDELGRGGMGVVLKARHKRMQRRVAIKVLPAKLTADADAIARFQREVVAASQLEHTNIVGAYDADEVDGRHIFVMQFVDGRDLSSIVRKQGPLSLKQAIDCVIQAARGLEFAHEQGVIHRDVKPANLLLDGKGVVKILDMGLARFSDAADVGTQAELTGSGTIMGTVDYMSPEQAMSTKNADARSDIYSLGMTLYYLLTGNPAYTGDTLMARLMAHANAPIPSLKDERPEVGDNVQAVFAKMAAKQPDDRYQTMTEVIADLEACRTEATGTAIVASAPVTDNESSGGLTGVLDDPSHPGNAVTTDFEKKSSVATKKRKRHERTQRAVDEPTLIGTIDVETSPTLPPVSSKRKLPTPRAVWTDRRVLGGIGTAVVLLLVAVFFSGDDDTPGVGGSESNSAVGNEQSSGDPKPPKSVNASPLAVAPFDEDEAKQHQQAWAKYLGLPVEKDVELPGGETMRFMLIPPGEFLMGATEEEQSPFLKEFQAANLQREIDHFPTERPQHRVQITRPFYMGMHEVTQAQWQAVMGSNPSKFTDDQRNPVEQVNWDDIQALLQILNARTPAESFTFALPTEAQWEYACRAGTTTHWHSGDSEDELPQYAWFGPQQIRPVGQLRPNAFGLYDMHGNVWEWCADWYASYAKTAQADPSGPASGFRHLCRGGSAQHTAYHCRSAFRLERTPLDLSSLGFRLVLTIDAVRLELTGSSNYALEFDGTSSFVETPLKYDGMHAITIEATVVPHDTQIGAVIGDGRLAMHFPVQGSDGASTQGRFIVANPHGGYVEASSREPIALGTRMHVAGVLDKNSITLFINGRRQSTKAITHELAASPFAFLIGADPPNNRPSAFYRGIIDEVRISNIARYNNDFTPQASFETDEETLALYHFDDGEGEVLKDSSGNNHHGKIVGAKWVRVDGSPIASEAPPPAVAPFDEAQAKAHQQAWADYLGMPVEKEVDLPGGEKMAFILIPPGEFLMGSTAKEQQRFLQEAKAGDDTWGTERISTEIPQHRVRITRPFYLGKHEATQAQWQAVMGGNPAKFQDDPTHPVEQVSWDDIQPFLASMNKEVVTAGLTFMLPTEAQWEFACRAGTTTPWHADDAEADFEQYGWCQLTSRGKTHPVGQLRPNAFGLQDMHGNVWEWCADVFVADYYAVSPVDDPRGSSAEGNRVHRGGGWQGPKRNCRSAARHNRGRNHSFNNLGFRLAASIDVAHYLAAKTDAAPAPAVAPFDAAQAKAHQQAWAEYLGLPVEKEVQLPGGEKMAFMLVPPGEFAAGSSKEEQDRFRSIAKSANWNPTDYANEGPPRKVRLERPYYLGKHELTVGQWKAIDAAGEALLDKGESTPVAMNWNTAASLVKQLNQKFPQPNLTFELPWEHQWEYACRAGTTSSYFFGDSADELGEYAWFNRPEYGDVQPVGRLKPNPWGLLDVLGNANEWCVNPLEPGKPERPLRGGGHDDPGPGCRCATRFGVPPNGLARHYGVRLALAIDVEKLPAPNGSTSPATAE